VWLRLWLQVSGNLKLQLLSNLRLGRGGRGLIRVHLLPREEGHAFGSDGGKTEIRRCGHAAVGARAVHCAVHRRRDAVFVCTAATVLLFQHRPHSACKVYAHHLFNAALKSYKCKTKKDLTLHLLIPARLQSCDSPEAILTVLREARANPGHSTNPRMVTTD
jgi:hypothetical protein